MALTSRSHGRASTACRCGASCSTTTARRSTSSRRDRDRIPRSRRHVALDAFEAVTAATAAELVEVGGVEVIGGGAAEVAIQRRQPVEGSRKAVARHALERHPGALVEVGGVEVIGPGGVVEPV